jgi:type 1 glutamine amidotransferase
MEKGRIEMRRRTFASRLRRRCEDIFPELLDRRLVVLAAVLLTCFLPVAADTAIAAGGADAQVLIVTGPSRHPPGTHEVAAGGRVVQFMLEHVQNAPPVRSKLVSEWPREEKIFGTVATIVMLGDLFPGETLAEPAKVKADLTRLMDRGCGMVCIHYATGLRAEHVGEDGDHPLLGWIGGYFSSGCPHHRSTARVCTATLVPAETAHPVLRGWKAFTFDDEPYWNNYFGKNGPAENVTPLVTSMLPPEDPKKETIAWAVERRDGGRGLGIVVPHFFRSWKIDDLRTLVLNGIFWTAKLDVPPEGLKSELPDLAAFEPAAVEPQRR